MRPCHAFVMLFVCDDERHGPAIVIDHESIRICRRASRASEGNLLSGVSGSYDAHIVAEFALVYHVTLAAIGVA